MTVTSSVPHLRPNWLPFAVGAAVFVVIAVAALASLLWGPQGATTTSVLAEPDTAHWLGTDAAGRDVLAMLLASSAGTILLAVFATVLSLLVGIPVGAAAAFRAIRLPPVSVAGVLPVGLLVGIVVSALSSVGNLTIIAAIAVPGMALVAAETRSTLTPLWAQDFVLSARLAGLGPLAAAQRHVLPTLLPRLGSLGGQLLGLAILLEVALSFAGLGTVAPGMSLGLMLAEAQPVGQLRPLLVLAPGLVILVLVLSARLIALALAGGRNGRP